MTRPREGPVETGDVDGTRGDQNDEVLLRVGGIIQDIEKDNREGIEHGSDILIGVLPLD